MANDKKFVTNADLKIALKDVYTELNKKGSGGSGSSDVTATERANWNAASVHANSAHAPVDAQKNVQADWNAESGDAFINNKPTALPADGGNADTVNNHSVESDVPADAVFTDTVTPVVNNLTSDSTTDALSAAQGKALKAYIDGIAGSALTSLQEI